MNRDNQTGMFSANVYEQIIASLSSGVIALDKHGAIISSNPAAGKHLGVAEDELASGVMLDSLEGIKPFLKVVNEAIEKHEGVSRCEITLPADEGAPKVIGLTASLLQGPDEFNGLILLFIDMTQMRKLEHAAEVNRQLAQIGELTAGVVHELRNPLSVISGTAELLMRKLGPADERRAEAQVIFHEAAHLEKAIEQFLGFARPFELELVRCRPEAIAERANQLSPARSRRKKNVRVSWEAEEGLPCITADRNKLAEALANIINNAIDAVPEEGCVRTFVYREGQAVIFEVTDNGPGIHIPPDKDLFRPFFTTKEGGTGLGLSIVQRIVTAHDGTVQYSNRDEGGARFEIRLPCET